MKRNALAAVMVDISVVILTYNEEANIAQALESVAGWASEIFLDSLSSDRTLEIARQYGCHMAQNKFENYAKQRNYALDHLPIHSEWVLFLDADEWLPDVLKQEISTLVASSPEENGFYINRRLIWMGRWIRRGYYPTWLLRLFRHRFARCEDRAVNEHLIVEGAKGFLSNDFIHEDHNGIERWVQKHLRYATAEAESLARGAGSGELGGRLWGSQTERKRWIREHGWRRLPPLVRPFVYFGYRYFVRGGFLDGAAGLSFHVMQALWFQLLVDLEYLEMTRAERPRTHLGGESQTRMERERAPRRRTAPHAFSGGAGAIQ